MTRTDPIGLGGGRACGVVASALMLPSVDLEKKRGGITCKDNFSTNTSCITLTSQDTVFLLSSPPFPPPLTNINLDLSLLSSPSSTLAVSTPQILTFSLCLDLLLTSLLFFFSLSSWLCTRSCPCLCPWQPLCLPSLFPHHVSAGLSHCPLLLMWFTVQILCSLKKKHCCPPTSPRIYLVHHPLPMPVSGTLLLAHSGECLCFLPLAVSC